MTTQKAAITGVGVFLAISCIAVGGISPRSKQRVYPDDIAEQLNKNKTGSVVSWRVWRTEETYLFVRDFKKSRTKPIFLCHMNRTATQGSYNAKWSKDKQMVAVYDYSSEMFPELHFPKWVIGYDWKRGRILHSKEIVRALALHGGVGPDCKFPRPHAPSSLELKQFEPGLLHRRPTP